MGKLCVSPREESRVFDTLFSKVQSACIPHSSTALTTNNQWIFTYHRWNGPFTVSVGDNFTDSPIIILGNRPQGISQLDRRFLMQTLGSQPPTNRRIRYFDTLNDSSSRLGWNRRFSRRRRPVNCARHTFQPDISISGENHTWGVISSV